MPILHMMGIKKFYRRIRKKHHGPEKLNTVLKTEYSVSYLDEYILK